MPKQTFVNLDTRKKRLITESFLREFTIKSYDEASITEVVKELGIAKGSVYQYFDNKLDLYMHLIEVCSNVKMRYIASLKRTDYSDFWAYFRDLYVHGYDFDSENPLKSHFLHNLVQNLNSPSVKTLFDQMKTHTIAGFEKLVSYEVEQGLFRSDIPIRTQAFLLYKIGVSIQEYLEHTRIINPTESIKTNEPVYKHKKTVLLQTVDEFIRLSKPSFNKSIHL